MTSLSRGSLYQLNMAKMRTKLQGQIIALIYNLGKEICRSQVICNQNGSPSDGLRLVLDG